MHDNFMSEQLIPLRIADQAVAACNKEIDSLRAELVLLRSATARLYELFDEAQSEADRLRAAGDAMAFIMAHQKDSEFDGFVEAWNAAKEGKQP